MVCDNLNTLISSYLNTFDNIMNLPRDVDLPLQVCMTVVLSSFTIKWSKHIWIVEDNPSRSTLTFDTSIEVLL